MSPETVTYRLLILSKLRQENDKIVDVSFDNKRRYSIYQTPSVKSEFRQLKKYKFKKSICSLQCRYILTSGPMMGLRMNAQLLVVT